MPQAVAQLLNPVMAAPENCAAVQVNVLPGIVEFKITRVVAPLQVICGDADPDGLGFTVTSTVNVFPIHPAGDVGVTVYLTTPAMVLLVLVNA